MTDQLPALESAGLNGQVESILPLLSSSLKKVCRGHSQSHYPLLSPLNRMIEWAVIYFYAH